MATPPGLLRRPARAVIKFTILLTGQILLSAAASFAQSPHDSYAQVKGPLNVEQLSSHFEYFEDASWNRTIADITGTESDKFKPINMSEPDFGYIDSRMWLRVRLRNATPDIADWRLYTRENFLQHYSVYVERANGETQMIEKHIPGTTFSDRLIQYPELVTPIAFKPDEKITLYVAYWSEGSSNAAISLETSTSFAQIAITRTSKNYIFYGMMGILIIAAILGLTILRLPVFLAYLTYVTLTLIYLMHVDGVTFQYMWPHLPRLNSYFTIIIGMAFIMATYYFARTFLQSKQYHPAADRVLFWMGNVTPLIIIPGAFIDPQLTKQIIMPLILIAIISGTAVGLQAARTRFRQVRFYLFAWLFGIFASGLMNMRHVFGFDISQDTEFDSIRISIVVDAVMMGLAIADRYIQIQRQRQKDAQDSLVAAQQNLRLNTRLFDLEEQYKLAVEMASTRDKDMNNTIHDLRQPLHALRLNIQNASNPLSLTDNDNTNIDDTFSYLETLLSAHLETVVHGSNANVDDNNVIAAADTMDLSVQHVLKSVHEMFLPDALENGLEFRLIPSRHDAQIEPFVLIRIMSNLISNAIKYTPSGKILMGSRRAGDILRVEVHDTGIGMTLEEFEQAKGQNTRLDEGRSHADGAGLGLSIASELAQKHGLKLYLSPYRQNGTGLILEIPMALNE